MLAFDVHGPGRGPVVALIHGWPLNRTIWSEIAPALGSAGFRTVALDLPGFGESPPLSGFEATVEAFADAVASSLRHFGGKVALAGHSFGGYVALALAERHPEFVTGLAVLASRTLSDPDAAKRGRQESIEKVRAQGTAALLPGLAEKLVAPKADPVHRSRALRLIREASPAAVIAGLAAMASRPDRTAVLGAFRGPVLVLHGDGDALIPLPEAAVPPAAASFGSRVILRNAGHMPMWDATKETAEALRAWAEAARVVSL